ncbi:hypothetical protein [Pseudarthrobacter oxydans]|uniref:hypothetical protein n=1 Tax=Pseudarthrobacter oxydans TaxID=1671 RepID=UPI003D291B36
MNSAVEAPGGDVIVHNSRLRIKTDALPKVGGSPAPSRRRRRGQPDPEDLPTAV